MHGLSLQPSVATASQARLQGMRIFYDLVVSVTMETSSLFVVLMHHLIAAYLFAVIFHSSPIVETINSIAKDCDSWDINALSI